MSKAKTWGAFNWEDPFLLERQLTEEERLVRDNAKSFALECLFPRVLQDFRHEQFDRHIIQQMGHRTLKFAHPYEAKRLNSHIRVFSPRGVFGSQKSRK